MTFAWYGHIASNRLKAAPLWAVVVLSWGIAFLEYCFQVPANRIGHNQGYTGSQLKIMQEAITLVVFVAFSVVFLPEEKLGWKHGAGFGLLLAAVVFVYRVWQCRAAMTRLGRTEADFVPASFRRRSHRRASGPVLDPSRGSSSPFFSTGKHVRKPPRRSADEDQAGTLRDGC